MIYLLDANVLITAKNFYYPLDRVPEFWSWLEHQGNEGCIKIPIEVYEELKAGGDDLANWVSIDSVTAALRLDEDADIDLVRKVMNDGYAPDLRDDELEKMGRDPFLIVHALEDPEHRTVVTVEVSKPKRTRGNRHVPDVCNDLGVNCCDTFEMMQALDFRTNWRGTI